MFKGLRIIPQYRLYFLIRRISKQVINPQVGILSLQIQAQGFAEIKGKIYLTGRNIIRLTITCYDGKPGVITLF